MKNVASFMWHLHGEIEFEGQWYDSLPSSWFGVLCQYRHQKVRNYFSQKDISFRICVTPLEHMDGTEMQFLFSVHTSIHQQHPFLKRFFSQRHFFKPWDVGIQKQRFEL